MELNTLIPQILEISAYAVAIATIIARLTKTKKDDIKVEKARKIIEKISNLFLPDRK